MRLFTTLLVLALAIARVCSGHQAGTRGHRQLQQGRRRRRVRRRDRHGGARGSEGRWLQGHHQPATAGEQRQHRAERRARERAGAEVHQHSVQHAAARCQGVDTFLAEIANKSNQPAYVHCGSASRVGSVWLAQACDCRMAGRSRRRPKKRSRSDCAARRSRSLRSTYIAEHKK